MALLRPGLVLALAVLFGASIGCGSSSTTVLSPSPPGGRCGLTLDVSSSSIGAAGGAGVVRIQTNRECSWAIAPQPSWVKLSQPTATQGPAEIAFVVDENRSTSLRTWEVVVADQRAMISQEAATCTWSLSPSKLSIDASGGDAQAVLKTEEFCSWELPSPVPWIALVPDRGQGMAEITVRVSRNTGGTRTGNVRVSSASIEVAQREAPPAPSPAPPAPPAPAPPKPAPTPPAPEPPTIPPVVTEPPPASPPPPCTFTVAPVKFADVAATALTIHVDVKTQAGCTWTSQSGTDWLRVPGDTKTGSGRVEVSVSANEGAARNASIVVAEQSVTIEQRAVVCTFTLSRDAFTTSAAGGTVSVSLNAPAGCAWSVTGAPNWVTVSSASGTGPATLSVAVAANPGAARSTLLIIGGRELRIEQAQLPCTYTVTPEGFTLSYRRREREIQVATHAHCQWSATSSASWVRVSSGVKTGSGALEVKVEENKSSDTRFAVVTIAGQNFSKEVTIAQDEEDD